MKPLHVALVLAVLGAVGAWQVTLIPESLMQMTVGPTLVPAVVVGGLLVLTVVYGISAARGREVDESLAEDQSPMPGASARLLSLLGGGLAFIVLIGPLGFVIPGTLCGMGVARAFDAPVGLRSLLICGAIATAFWLLFAVVLGVGLGPALPWLV